MPSFSVRACMRPRLHWHATGCHGSALAGCRGYLFADRFAIPSFVLLVCCHCFSSSVLLISWSLSLDFVIVVF